MWLREVPLLPVSRSAFWILFQQHIRRNPERRSQKAIAKHGEKHKQPKQRLCTVQQLSIIIAKLSSSLILDFSSLSSWSARSFNNFPFHLPFLISPGFSVSCLSFPFCIVYIFSLLLHCPSKNYWVFLSSYSPFHFCIKPFLWELACLYS